MVAPGRKFCQESRTNSRCRTNRQLITCRKYSRIGNYEVGIGNRSRRRLECGGQDGERGGMEMDEQMANQPDNHGIVVSTTVEDARTPQNGAAVDSSVIAPPAIAATVDGAALAVEKAPAPRIDKDLVSPDLYLNRELTWLAFNRRVLHEAEDARNPLLEQLKFLAITASNLDEFFMKRIGGLKQQVVAGMHELTVDGRTPQQQIDECYLVVRDLEERKREVGPHNLRQLEDHGIRLRLYASLSDDECKSVREYYYKNIFPLVTPQAMDPAHPFPFVSNLSLNLLVTARYQNDSDPLMARVKVPIGFGIPRFIRVGKKNDFVRLEDVVANNLDLLFPSMLIDSYELFRVTRNANTERDEDEADDLLALIESELRDRRFAPIVRLEVMTGINPVHRGMLAAELGLDERADVFEVDGMLSMRDLAELAALDEPALHDPPHHPIDHPRLTVGRSIFHVLRDAGSFLLLHPYESFSTSVERFLRDAARNGKQVAVVVELKARFDEAANIQFATRLEEFRIHVTYGVVGLKTHSKVILVIRQDYNGLRRYAHIGTGNYHPVTARFYADFGLLTCDSTIGEDLTELFNYLTTGYMPNRRYRKILPAPTVLKRALLSRIEREVKASTAASPGLIQFKMNALEDVDITRALYRASQAGVKIDLIVRDTCRLRPGIQGLSETVRVVSIVGRFLEHGRIYYFRNGGVDDYFIGSADCMKRNLESRVEVVTPVEDPQLRKELRTVLDIQLRPNRCQWEMQSDGTYIKSAVADAAPACQQAMIDFAETRQTEATKVKRRRAKGFARRAIRERNEE